jgi:Xaa-Pro aminopeptidase
MPHTQRLQRLQNALQHATLIEEPLSLFYLTGLHLSAGKLLITPTQALLIVDGRYIESAQAHAPLPCALLKDDSLQSTLADFGARHLCFISQDTSYQRYTQLKDTLNIPLEAIEDPVRSLRLIKDPSELDRLRRAGQLGSQGYDLVCGLIGEGVTERELAKELELFWLRQGGEKVAFKPIIAFGPNSSKPHHHPSDARLQPGQPVLIDIGVTLDDYHSDMTRVVFYQTADPEIAEIYEIVLKAHQAATEACRPGITAGELDKVARDIIAQAGYVEQFSHSLGHGIGLEVHEAPGLRQKKPDNDMVLQAGMVITIEPGIYLPGKGGVRIEDTVIVTPNGTEDLTQRPKELKIV